MCDERNIKFVRARYPDAAIKKWTGKINPDAKLSICIWSSVLDRRLSDFEYTDAAAWASAVEWINRKQNDKLGNTK